MKVEQIRRLLELAFTNDDLKIPFEIKNIDEEAQTCTVEIQDAKGETAFVKSVLESFKLVPVPSLFRSEVAFFGGVEFSNSAYALERHYAELAEMAEDADKEDEAEAKLEADKKAAEEEEAKKNRAAVPDPELPAEVSSKTPKQRSEIARSLDIPDDSKLKVIRDSSTLKTANKIYEEMVSPGDNRENYAAFLFNFDDFLMMHRPSTDYQVTEDEYEEDDSLEPVTPPPLRELSSAKMPLKNSVELLKFFGDLETASTFLDSFRAFLPAEIAKGKGARGELLSKLMTAMSGEQGAAAIAAWESGDKDKLKASLTNIVSEVTA